MSLGDVYYILFRHKWKIAGCFLVGLAATIVFAYLESPLYYSEAKLLVRYIISESKITGPNANSATAKILADERGESIMATEQEILSSIDLAEDVAKTITPEKLLAKAGGGKDLPKAIKVLREGLRVVVPKGSTVIHVNFRHNDPEIVQPVLREVLDRYLKLHVSTHRASGMLSDSLAQEADTLRARLAQTEADLRNETSRAGVISLESAKEAYATQITAIRREILGYQAELAGRSAVLEQLKKRISPVSTSASESAPEPDVPVSVVDQYRALTLKISRLQSLDQELSVQFTAENDRVKQARGQLAEAEAALKGLRDQYPRLGRATVGTATVTRTETDPSAEEAAATAIQITSYQAKIKELSAQYEQLRTEATKLDQREGAILELRRRKELDEANYRYYAANLEQARINETLGAGKVSNISQIQAASPAFREIVNYKKPALALLGGLLAGLAWAFLVELYLDRSVRRPDELAQLVRAPLFLSIPQLSAKQRSPSQRPSHLALPGGSADLSKVDETAPPAPSGAAALLPFHETLRDRLISFFESKNLTHKPKLVAVTGVLDAAGVTTTAAGLARSLSETGEGNVLLVDMTVDQGAAKQFLRGKEVCGLDELLEARSQAHVHENLYVVAESNNSERLSRNLPKRFTRLIPQLKASDFDYIIFDMPKVSQLSITPRLASFMDMVLLVVESEKTDRGLVQGACDLLGESKVNVGIVLNKTRRYVPVRFQQELMAT